MRRNQRGQCAEDHAAPIDRGQAPEARGQESPRTHALFEAPVIARGYDKAAEHEEHVDGEIAVTNHDARPEQQFAMPQHHRDGAYAAKAVEAEKAPFLHGASFGQNWLPFRGKAVLETAHDREKSAKKARSNSSNH